MSLSPRRGGLVTGALAALLLAAAIPWALRPWFLAADQLPRDDGRFAPMENADLLLNAWILAWGAHAAIAEPTRLFDGNAFHPAPSTLALSENMFAHLPVTAPVMAATGSALAVLKAMAFESFLLAGLAMLAWVYRATGDAAGAMLAAAAFTLAPWRVQGFPHPQYLGTAAMPAALLAVDLWLERGRRGALWGLGAAVAWQVLSCLYLALFLLVGLPVYALVRIGGLPRAERLRAAVGVGAAVAAGVALASPVLVPYLRARAAGVIPPFDPSRFAGHTWAPWDYLGSGFAALAGAVPLLAVALDLGARLGRRIAGRRGDGLGRRAWALWALAATGVVLSSGPSLAVPGLGTLPTPYRILYDLVPGFSAIRGPRRFFILVLVGLCALAGEALARVGRRGAGRGRLALGAAAIALCAAVAAPRPSPVQPAGLGASAPPVYRWLASRPEPGAVLELPEAAVDGDLVGNLRNARYMLSSTLHWRPLVNGFSGYEPPSASFLRAATRRLPSLRALQLLVDSVDLRWVVLHRGSLAGGEIDRWSRSRFPGLRRVARLGTDEVFEPALERRRDWREEVREAVPGPTLTGLSTAPLPSRCRRGRILAVEPPPVIALTAFPVPVPVRFENASDCAWPAVGVRADGLVGLSFRWHAPDGGVRRRGPLSRLLADVRPGSTVSDSVVVIPPFGEPGRWGLEVLLVQEGQPEPLASRIVPVDVRPLGNAR